MKLKKPVVLKIPKCEKCEKSLIVLNILISLIVLVTLFVVGVVLYGYGYENGRDYFRELLKECEKLEPTENYVYWEFDSSRTTFSFNCYKTQRGELVFGEWANKLRWLDEFSKRVEENREELWNNGEGKEI